MSGKCPFHFFSRRQFLKTAGGGVGFLAASSALAKTAVPSESASESGQRKPVKGPLAQVAFWGQHQAGIVTPQQGHTYFAAFDLTTSSRDEVIQLLKDWTAASAQLAEDKKVDFTPRKKNLEAAPERTGDESSYGAQAPSGVDSSEAEGLGTGHLTLTFGFGAGLFTDKDGKDRYGLAKHKPEALAALPKFHGDELIAEKTGGDLSVQACGDDQQLVFHAVRELARIAEGIAQIRWVQTGFLAGAGKPETPRNLMGFKDGTQQPKAKDYSKVVWVSDDSTNRSSPQWMRGGTYLVARRIRIALEHWDRTDVDFQEQVIGRKKQSGAPLGQNSEKEVIKLDGVDKDGGQIIAGNAHVRLAAPEVNDGAQILRRGYSYNEGANFTAERWPPWRQGLEYDAGLFFICYQTDPRTGFSKIFENMAKIDALNQFVTHVGSGLFACPPGVKKGEFIGQALFLAT